VSFRRLLEFDRSKAMRGCSEHPGLCVSDFKSDVEHDINAIVRRFTETGQMMSMSDLVRSSPIGRFAEQAQTIDSQDFMEKQNHLHELYERVPEVVRREFPTPASLAEAIVSGQLDIRRAVDPLSQPSEQDDAPPKKGAKKKATPAPEEGQA